MYYAPEAKLHQKPKNRINKQARLDQELAEQERLIRKSSKQYNNIFDALSESLNRKHR